MNTGEVVPSDLGEWYTIPKYFFITRVACRHELIEPSSIYAYQTNRARKAKYRLNNE